MKSVLTLFMLFISLHSHSAPYLKVNVLALTGADSTDEERIDKALLLIEEVVNSEEFRSELLSMKYKIGKKEYAGFSQTQLTPQKVLESIEEAVENFPGGKKNEIDLFLDMYYQRSSTIGYTSPSDKFIHMNRYFHSRYTSVETAGNIFHEWLHKIGHGHTKNNNAERPHSVPYKLGNLVARLSAEREAQGDPILKELMEEKVQKEVNCHH